MPLEGAVTTNPPSPRVSIRELDNTRSAVATFDLNLTNFVGGTVMLLAAVIRAGGDSALATDTLQKLALEDAHVAVRSLVIEKP
jgi:hypothetical protein